MTEPFEAMNRAPCLMLVYNRLMREEESLYLMKAVESLAGAESEYVNGRFNNCANRCYYACFQAAVAALEREGIRPTGSRATWAHDTLQATFARELIQHRKVYPADLRDALARSYKLREAADYARDMVSEIQAARILRRSRAFVQAVHQSRRSEQ